jgi:hypothetical protein
LACGTVRMLGRHVGKPGAWYRLHVRALQERYGPFDALNLDYAGVVSGGGGERESRRGRKAVSSGEGFGRR